jgi:hypothetical protein
MLNRSVILVASLVAVLTLFSSAFAQTAQSQQSAAAKPEKQASGPAPRHDISGNWVPAASPTALNQTMGVLAAPNDGKPGRPQLPYSPYGLQSYKSHKALEGVDSAAENGEFRGTQDNNTDFNDPRELCEPLGFPRMNHYHVGQTAIFQSEFSIAMLYQNDQRYRLIWTDGRDVPTLVDGGVHLGKGWAKDSNTDQESQFYGYSVGKWSDDTTLVVDTLGTMPEDRVWLDETGRPISDQLHVTETFHRVDHDHMEWTETINDPKMYTKPWVTMKATLMLTDPHQNPSVIICSPVEIARYYELYGNPASGVNGSKK